MNCGQLQWLVLRSFKALRSGNVHHVQRFKPLIFPCRLQSLQGTWCCDQLQWLDVSRNQLTQLHGLAAFPLLQSLVASNNRIAQFPPQLLNPLLRELWLNGNRHAFLHPT